MQCISKGINTLMVHVENVIPHVMKNSIFQFREFNGIGYNMMVKGIVGYILFITFDVVFVVIYLDTFNL